MPLTYFDKWKKLFGAVTVNNEKCAKKCHCGTLLCFECVTAGKVVGEHIYIFYTYKCNYHYQDTYFWCPNKKNVDKK